MCVASGDGDRSHATAHGRGGEADASGRWERRRHLAGGAVLSRRVVFRLCLRNGSCKSKRESVEMADLLPDSVELRQLDDGAPWGDVRVGWR